MLRECSKISRPPSRNNPLSSTSRTISPLPSKSYGASEKTMSNCFGQLFQVEKGVGLDRIDRFASQLPRRLPDEVVMHGVDFDRRDAASAARSEFVADRSRAREEVEYVALFEIDQIGQDVEKVLLGEVRRGTRPQILRRVDRPALVSAADYSHRTSLKYFRNWRASVSLPDRQSG